MRVPRCVPPMDGINQSGIVPLASLIMNIGATVEQQCKFSWITAAQAEGHNRVLRSQFRALLMNARAPFEAGCAAVAGPVEGGGREDSDGGGVAGDDRRGEAVDANPGDGADHALGPQRQLLLGELEADALAFVVGHDRRLAHGGVEWPDRERHAMGVLGGNHLLVVREATLDEPAIDHGPLGLHQDFVGPQTDADGLNCPT